MKKKILLMMLAMTMLAGCGAKEEVSKSDDTVNVSTEVVTAEPTAVVDEVTDVAEQVVDTAEQVVSENTSEVEVTEMPEVTELPPIDAKNSDFKVLIGRVFEGLLYLDRDNPVSEDGVELISVTRLPIILGFEFIDRSHYDLDSFIYDCSFEYVDIDGETWLQMTFNLPDGIRDWEGNEIDYENNFVITSSLDTHKFIYRGVVYTDPEKSQ